MISLVPPIMKTPAERSLLQRAEFALTSLRHRERAALYHAAASTLQLAMAKAEEGDPSTLDEWLESHGDLFEGNDSSILSSVRDGVSHDNESERLSRDTLPSIELPKEPISVESGQSPVDVAPVDVASDDVAPDDPDDVAPDDVANPWRWMEQCAARRLETHQIALPTSDKAITIEQEALELKPALDPLEDHHKIEATYLVPKSERKKTLRDRLAAPHVWVSLLLHLLAIPILGYIVIAQVIKTEKLAIVSAPFESDNVLTETALEMPSTLDATDLSPPVSTPAEPTLPSDLTLPALEPVGTSPAAQSSSSNSISEALKSGKGTPASDKLVMGAEFFGVKATGNTFVYIVDCSPSMKRDGAFDAAKQEIGRSLMSMKPTQRFYLMFFGKEIERLSLESGKPEEFPVYATAPNIQKAIEWLARAAIQKDGWPPNDSLDKAIEMQPDGIFMLFDGDTRSDVAKHLSKVNRTTDILSEPGPKVPVHVVHFFQEEFAPAMRKVATENSGSYRFVTRPERNKSSKK